MPTICPEERAAGVAALEDRFLASTPTRSLAG